MSPNTTFQQFQHPNNPWDRRSCFHMMAWTAGFMNSILLALNGLAMFVPCPTANERDTAARVVVDLCGFAVRVAPFALAISGGGLFLAVLAGALTHANLPISGAGGVACALLALVTGGVLGVAFVVLAGSTIAFYLLTVNPGMALIIGGIALAALSHSASQR